MNLLLAAASTVERFELQNPMKLDDDNLSSIITSSYVVCIALIIAGGDYYSIFHPYGFICFIDDEYLVTI